MVPTTMRAASPAKRANLGRRETRFSIGIDRVMSPSRDEPSLDAGASILGRRIDVVLDLLTRPSSQVGPRFARQRERTSLGSLGTSAHELEVAVDDLEVHDVFCRRSGRRCFDGGACVGVD